MATPSLLTAFNDHFNDFVSDIQSVFPEDPDILTGYNIFGFDEKYIYDRT